MAKPEELEDFELDSFAAGVKEAADTCFSRHVLPEIPEQRPGLSSGKFDNNRAQCEGAETVPSGMAVVIEPTRQSCNIYLFDCYICP